ncbi:hypothetical protein [Burkholderia sp. SIMBA_062]|uniref:hypothetical protein n=1 Tax=Burkholderia sp. SIMBA_062 TaxID=3085803 RepID=UPI00397C87E4
MTSEHPARVTSTQKFFKDRALAEFERGADARDTRARIGIRHRPHDAVAPAKLRHRAFIRAAWLS